MELGLDNPSCGGRDEWLDKTVTVMQVLLGSGDDVILFLSGCKAGKCKVFWGN